MNEALPSLPTRLLYVEDDDDLRDMVAGAFVRAGYDVTPVMSAEAALDELGSGRFDIVVTDYNLTGQTGAWLLASAGAKGYLDRTAALVLTSEKRPAGVAGFTVLRKPIDFGALLAAIGAAVGELVPTAPLVGVVVPPPPPRELELVLYVTATSQDSHKAIRNLRRALKPYDARRFRLTIVDVAEGGDDAWYQGLEDDRVIVTPTLVRKRPGPRTWIIGALDPIEAVAHLLTSALGEPPPA